MAANGGPVTVTAQVNAPNSGDTHNLARSRTDNTFVDTDGNAQNATLVFNLIGLNPGGRYAVRLDVTDSQAQLGAHVSSSRYSPTCRSLIRKLIPMRTELTTLLRVPVIRTMECDPGVHRRFGKFALLGATSGTCQEESDLAEQKDLVPDVDYDPVGGIFDFEIRDILEARQSVRIVIPQRAAIPAEAVYRKFRDGGWYDFVGDAKDILHSTAGNEGEGSCPPPDESWEPGLLTGHLCAQLTIEDGDPNDAKAAALNWRSIRRTVHKAKANL